MQPRSIESQLGRVRSWRPNRRALTLQILTEHKRLLILEKQRTGHSICEIVGDLIEKHLGGKVPAVVARPAADGPMVQYHGAQYRQQKIERKDLRIPEWRL
jgi:hypothetical protein